jgi:hypothetical protein
MVNEDDNKAIKARIDQLTAATNQAQDLIVSYDQQGKHIPLSIAKTKPTAIVEDFIEGPDWYLGKTSRIGRNSRRGDIIRMLAWNLKPAPEGLFSHWIIPAQYAEGLHHQYTECMLTRVAYLLYSLTTLLLGPMAAKEVRAVYEQHQIEWRSYRDYVGEELAASGLKLIDPAYSERHARDFWPQDDHAAYKRGDLDGLGRPVKL